MRIIYMHQYFNTPSMPGSTRSFEMGRRLVSAGHEVHMITSDREPGSREWRTSDEAGMSVHWAPVAYNNSMGYAQRMRAFIEFAIRAGSRAASLEGDVVFATSTPLTIVLPAVRASRSMRAPMVLEVRDLWPAVPIALGVLRDPVSIGMAKWLERYAYRNAARIVALAPGMRDEVVAAGYPEDHTSVIPNGCDLDVFSVPADAGTELRARTPWLGERPLVVYAGTIGKVHNVEYLVELAAAVAPIAPDVRFAVIGAGKHERRVRDLARERGVLGTSLFMPGPLPKSEIATWLSACSMATALASGPEIVWRDSTNNKFFDALAAGRPVASNLPGWSARIAEEAGAGVTLPFDDVEAAAATLIERLRDTTWLASAGRASEALARETFDRDLLAAQLEQVLMDAVAESGVGG